jgi:hypothetical protein
VLREFASTKIRLPIRCGRRLLVVLPVLLLLAGAATIAEADSIGPLPPPAQSYCATFSISNHFPKVHQKVVMTVTPHFDVCGQKFNTWTFPALPNAKAIHGCRDTGLSCTYLVTGGAATGTPGNRVLSECLTGTDSGRHSDWVSCDYYAFLPDCNSSPVFRVDHHRAGRSTIVTLTGKKWNVPGCGAVTITASVEGHDSQVLGVINTSSFSKRIPANGRLCGIQVRAEQPNGRARSAGFTLGARAPVQVVIAHPGTTPSGEQLHPGDMLCKGELGGFHPDHFTTADARSLARHLGQQLLEVASGGHVILADTAGLVSANGVSYEAANPTDLSARFDWITKRSGVVNLRGTPYDSLAVEGYAFTSGPLTVQGNLDINGGVLLVNGDLNVSGMIRGLGAVFATGSITASGGAILNTDSREALVAGGSLNLP